MREIDGEQAYEKMRRAMEKAELTDSDHRSFRRTMGRIETMGPIPSRSIR